MGPGFLLVFHCLADSDCEKTSLEWKVVPVFKALPWGTEDHLGAQLGHSHVASLYLSFFIWTMGIMALPHLTGVV